MIELYSKLSEPGTAMVDIIGGLLILYWGHELFWKWSLNFSKTTTRFWGLFFLFSGLGALLYAVIQTFQDVIPIKLKEDLKISFLFLFVSSISSLFLTGIKSFIHPRAQRLFIAIIVIFYIINVFVIFNRMGFENYVYYYFWFVLFFVLTFNLSKYLKYRRTSNKFVFFGLAIQPLAFFLNHLDRLLISSFVLHILMMLSFYLLYIGARFSKDHVGE